MPKDVFDAEAETLRRKISEFQEGLQDMRILRDRMPDMYKSQPDLLAEMMAQANRRIINLQRGLNNPYFARIDFKDDDAGRTEKCYIGKIGLIDENQKLVTVDWRAPIASLYYDSNLGNAAYSAPAGMISGKLLLKRQYEIDKGKLISWQDVETVSNDDLLKPYLSTSADNRLKNIVASIQREQNAVIREKIYRNLIVQGVAGSGKTTVALHRIAYLVYNYRDTIVSSQYMVIGPNRFFISYISSVLPDLDVNSVPDHTFETLGSDYIDENFTLTDSAGRLNEVLDGVYQGEIDRLKTSLDFKAAIDTFMEAFFRTVVPDKDFIVRGFTVLTCDMIKRTYAKLDITPESTLQDRVNRCMLRLSTYIENHQETIRSELNQYFHEIMQGDMTPKQLERLRGDRAAALKEVELGCRQSLKKYFAITETRIMKLYSLFWSGCEKYLPGGYSQVSGHKAVMLNALRKKQVDFSDLPALMYIKLRMKGPGDYKLFRHTVIDEAQDFGVFHFFVLRKLLCQSTFTIVGDLAQSIYNYRSIENWESVCIQAFGGKATITELRKSYRTTVEIMTAANKISSWLGIGEALPVIRHGDPVRFSPCSAADQPDRIHKLILEYLEKGLKTIAVICKTAEQSRHLNQLLAARGFMIEDINSKTERYQGGICTIPCYLSKGLEFDGVILLDVSEEVYSSQIKVDMHLLYVSMTRALHCMDILFSGSLTRALREM